MSREFPEKKNVVQKFFEGFGRKKEVDKRGRAHNDTPCLWGADFLIPKLRFGDESRSLGTNLPCQATDS